MWRASILSSRWTLAFSLTTSLAAPPALAQPPTASTTPAPAASPSPAIPSSPLDSSPARFDYVTNAAPFVVFDIAPRTLNAAAAIKAFKSLTLSFVATEPLHRVDVFTYVVPQRGAAQEVPTRIACGSTMSGHYDCSVPTRDALLLLKGGEGLFGLRIEAEGIEGDRSTVRITLPVKSGTGKVAPAKVTSRLPLSLLGVTTTQQERTAPQAAPARPPCSPFPTSPCPVGR